MPRRGRATHECRARSSRACLAELTAATAAPAPTVLSRSRHYLKTIVTTEPIFSSSSPVELLAVLGDHARASFLAVEDGQRPPEVMALITSLTSGSCTALRRLLGHAYRGGPSGWRRNRFFTTRACTRQRQASKFFAGNLCMVQIAGEEWRGVRSSP